MIKWFFLFMLTSCTQLQFHSEEKIPIWGQEKELPARYFQIHKMARYYLWGLYPSKVDILLDDLIIQEGYDKAYDLKISEYQTWDNLLMELLTLGMYIPKNYSLSGRGVKFE